MQVSLFDDAAVDISRQQLRRHYDSLILYVFVVFKANLAYKSEWRALQAGFTGSSRLPFDPARFLLNLPPPRPDASHTYCVDRLQMNMLHMCEHVRLFRFCGVTGVLEMPTFAGICSLLGKTCAAPHDLRDFFSTRSCRTRYNTSSIKYNYEYSLFY